MGKAKEIVKLRFKKLKNGEKSAYFDIYRNGVREYLWQEERLVPELDEMTKENNQKLMLLFEERRRSLIAELTIDKSGIANRAFNTDITLPQWLDIYEIELLQRASRSYMRGYSKLKDYLQVLTRMATVSVCLNSPLAIRTSTRCRIPKTTVT